MKHADLKVRILKIPGAKDPDEFIREHGREAFAGLLERSEDHMEFTLDRIRSQFDLKTDEGRVGFLQEAAKELARLQALLSGKSMLPVPQNQGTSAKKRFSLKLNAAGGH